MYCLVISMATVTSIAATWFRETEERSAFAIAEPSAKKPRLSLKLKKNNDDGEPTELNFTRFESPEKSLESYQRGFVPKNTEVNTKWAVRNFMSEYNSHHSDKPCSEDILLTDSSSDLSYWLQKYVLGTTKKGGQCYPPKTVYLLLCGLNHFMKEHKKQSFDRENPDFKLLFNTCDSYFRELRENGVGSASKATEVINREDEELLWSSGVLSASSARGLLNAVFFLNGKNFALRGGIEHRCLKLSQIVCNTSPEGKIRYTYTLQE